MRTAFAKHAVRANLRSLALCAALAATPAALVLPVPGALASTTGGAAATTATTTAPATSGTGSGGAAALPLTSRPTIATWFGPGFYGSTTACGQKMSPALVGVASRTLACGTLVQVTYRGHRLTVPVVDRGPYGHIGASWDLTAGAARALNIKETVRITTVIVGNLPNTPALGVPIESSSSAASSTSASSPSAAAASTTGGAAAS